MQANDTYKSAQTLQTIDPLQWELTRVLSLREEVLLKRSLIPAVWDSFQGKSAVEMPDTLLEHYFDKASFVDAYRLDLKTHADVVSIVRFLKGNLKLNRAQLVHKMSVECHALVGPLHTSIHNAVELASQIWLMLTTENWNHDSNSFEEFVHNAFQIDQSPIAKGQFPLALNAYALENIGSVQIIWTDKLEDHLSLTCHNRQHELRVFHLISFLRGYRDSNESQIFPSGLLGETERTIALLFPSSNIKCRKWIKKAQKEDRLDLRIGLLPPVTRDLQEYPYWRSRLIALIDQYDSIEPTTLKQWIMDRRRPNQRYTFWIAVLALTLSLLFGLVQSVTGILQLVVAMKSLAECHCS